MAAIGGEGHPSGWEPIPEDGPLEEEEFPGDEAPELGAPLTELGGFGTVPDVS